MNGPEARAGLAFGTVVFLTVLATKRGSYDGRVLHMWHGAQKNREYTQRLDILIAVGYRSDGQQRLSKTSVGITVGRPFEQLPASGEFVCSINRLPITPGRYSLGASCSADGEVVHGVPHAGPFNVVDGAFYETGNLPPVGAGNALIDYTWALHEGTQARAADVDVP